MKELFKIINDLLKRQRATKSYSYRELQSNRDKFVRVKKKSFQNSLKLISIFLL